MKRVLVVALLAVLVLSSFAFAEKTQITWWHAMSGSRLPIVNAIVDGFNASHPDIQLTAMFTGSYSETLTKFIASYKTGTAPNLVQVYEVGTQTMLDSQAIIPVYKVPGMLGETWDWAQYIIPITNYYSTNGNLWSMPFNSSTAMLYYNKDLFTKAGLDPNKPPTTWKEVEEYGQKLHDSGVKNVLSFGWPGWIFEQMFTTHNQLFANNNNGRSGLATKMLFNGDFGTMVLGTWTKLAKEGIFLYGGPEYSANTAFKSGQLAMLLQSTSSLSGIEQGSEFAVGTSFLPRFEGYPMGDSVIGGGSLWIRKGQSTKELNAVWEFLKYLAKTDVAIQWHKGTGYFPTVNSAVKALLDEGWFSKDQNYLTAFLQILSGRRDTAAVRGVRLGPFVQIREIERTAIEKAVSGVMTPKQALDEAAQKADQLLQDYAALNS
ncbi:MAG TPA: ABC transporter substrate-binding protein [Candidatus Acetothermia bacterium]|nr:ABC transporter substrate-binding protein [Candidatus Acetothermia bacterium]